MFKLSEEVASLAMSLAMEGLGQNEAVEFEAAGGRLLLSIDSEGMIPLHHFFVGDIGFFVGIPVE